MERDYTQQILDYAKTINWEAVDHLWRVTPSGNPNKAWVTSSGNKITPLISTKTAVKLVKAHNATVNYINTTSDKG